MKIFSKLLLVGAMTIAPALAYHGPAAAADFPTGAVTLISPYAPGGINDILARLLSAEMSDALKQTVIVVNRTGAGGAIGASELARAKPDGHTMMLGALGPLAVTKLINPQLPYDPRDFTPITEIGRAPMILAVNAGLGVNSLEELLKQQKADPSKWNYSSAGIGSPQHLGGVLFNQAIGGDIPHIAYRGSGPSATAVAAGEVQITFENLPPLLPLIQSGRVKPLAVLASERMSTLPDVPTMAELGFNNLEVSGWYGMVAPSGTPDAVVQELRRAILQALNLPATQTRLDDFGIVKTGTSPAEFGALIRSEYDRWKPIIDTLPADAN